ncbi:adenosylcobinamide-GDP ribazoletransferase [Treponema sp.]|uniref:adenosylcobinamide-GDP ribazoletransferase n=1 Tax=Treponema sp. TaxID=166 RepID=UPI00388F1DF2
MTFFKSFCLAFSTFSIIPVPEVQWNEKNMRYIMCAFPFTGLISGLLLSALFYLLKNFEFFFQKSPDVTLFALIFLLIPVIFTGGIHIDGFMDTCDAVASHCDTEKKLEIMKDSHCGAFSVISCVLYFISFYVFTLRLCRTPVKPLIFPVIFFQSRLLSSISVTLFPVAKTSSLVKMFSTSALRNFTRIWCIFFFILSLGFGFYLYGEFFLIQECTLICFFIWYYFFTKRNFGGITGDTAGFFVQLSELISLAIAALLF